MFEVPIGISARHIHLSPHHIEQIFGLGYNLRSKKILSQPGQYAAEETVKVVGPKGRFENVRILGPSRGNTQLEISRTDAYMLGIDPPLRASGDLDGTPGITVAGPKAEIHLDRGVIIAARHIHLHHDEAAMMNIRDQQIVNVKLSGQRGGIFHHVLCRVSSNFRLDMHIDTDEANAFGIQNGDKGTIIVI